MIQIRTTETPIPMKGRDFRPNAFPIYQSLLNSFNSGDLLLLESLGKNSVDSRVSMIGINPVLTLAIKDRFISLHSSSELLTRLRFRSADVTIIRTSNSVIEYQLPNRSSVWTFLRNFESQWSEVPGCATGVLSFACFSYETIHYIENIPGFERAAPDDYDIILVVYQAQLVLEEQRAVLLTYSFPGKDDLSVNKITEAVEHAFDESIVDHHCEIGAQFEIERETGRDAYLRKVHKAQHHVAIGDVYQVQIGQRIQVRSEATPLEVYRRLRELNPSPYMYLFSVNGKTVIGASPELLLRISDENEILMRPIAGTLGKQIGRTLKDAATHLRDDKKEVAEHMMLVDLCRNDLYRVSLPKTLDVSGLLDIEEYSHVYHMVSTVRATVKPSLDKYDALIAAFPAGTMTGTPKIRAMEIISDLEDSSRGLYAGALGIMGLGKNYINLALCIRSAVFKDNVYTLRASAGIVSDSKDSSEYQETLHKMGSMFKAITGKELSCHVE